MSNNTNIRIAKTRNTLTKRTVILVLFPSEDLVVESTDLMNKINIIIENIIDFFEILIKNYKFILI